jgi:voltage-gated potassium channel
MSVFLQFLWLFFRLPRTGKAPHQRLLRLIKGVQRLRSAVYLVLVSLAIGTAGFIILEDYPLLDAWYMSVITLATVGFGEIYPLSAAGRLFTSFLILFNVSLFAYAISSITSLFAEGGFTKLLSDFRMDQRIVALTGHTIVCGFGRHANEVVQELAKQGIPFVVVENNPDKVARLREETEYLYCEGDATHDEVLEEAGIMRAAALVVTLPSDSDNLFIVLSARQTNPALRIISRANNEADERKIRRAGADHTVVPERIGGFYMATLVNKPDLVEFFTLLSNMGPSNVVFEEIPIGQLREHFWHQTIAESGLLQLARVSVVAVRSPDGQYELNPSPDTLLLPKWDLVVLGNPEQMQGFRARAL